jgi:CTP synthase
MADKTKYIFVTGGVTSSLGKGIISASLANILQARGLRVTIQKFDPYINVDPGTMNPYEHGECYVTDDGAETDLDLGHYERFLNVQTSQDNNVTTGRIYHTVINQEREGKYLGKTVQVIPHITDEIKRNFKILGDSGKYDVVITEIGGCVGDIESLPFIESIRQIRYDLGHENCLVIHLTLIPFLKASGEQKTKPTQHSVKNLLEAGIQPEILVCRTEKPISMNIRQKIALFCNVPVNSVIEAIDADSIYDVPILMLKEKLDKRVLNNLRIKIKSEANMDKWKTFLGKLKNPTSEVQIGLIGKYVELQDAYKSIKEALIHAGAVNESNVIVSWIHSDELTKENIAKRLEGLNGILVAPGFGERGLEGKIEACHYARKNEIPFLGICLGMQCAVIEFSKNELKLKDATSSEMGVKSKNLVIDLMEEQKKIKKKGGTMRLGSYECKIRTGSKVAKIYGKEKISERHRHRFELNNKYVKDLEKAGMVPVGINPQSKLVEIVEISSHPFFIGTQFHPEFKSTVLKPHPIFVSFIKASIGYHKNENNNSE